MVTIFSKFSFIVVSSSSTPALSSLPRWTALLIPSRTVF